ncbi:unnamed protein product [Lepidochelys kempii]
MESLFSYCRNVQILGCRKICMKEGVDSEVLIIPWTACTKSRLWGSLTSVPVLVSDPEKANADTTLGGSNLYGSLPPDHWACTTLGSSQLHFLMCITTWSLKGKSITKAPHHHFSELHDWCCHPW